MKILLQRVKRASVSIEENVVGQINQGLLLLIGFTDGDDNQVIEQMVKKCIELRIFSDENGKMNKSLLDINGEILSISQFTLCATLDSRRPSFSSAAKPDIAKPLFDKFNEILKSYEITVKDGVFGEEMEVSLLNHGPFTIIITNNDL